MTPNELLDLMTYENEAQLEEAKKYIGLKGVVQYKRALDYCLESSLSPSYTNVSALYRYDKRLRDNLYRYLGTAEEYIRAIIGNYYEDNYGGLIKTKPFEIKYDSFNSVSLTLEHLTLWELIQMVLRNTELFQEIYDMENLETNLNALRVLRNKVGHHNFLLSEKYETCIKDGETSNSLQQNIKNLKGFLPKDFRDRFSDTIDKSAAGLPLPQNKVIKLIYQQ